MGKLPDYDDDQTGMFRPVMVNDQQKLKEHFHRREKPMVDNTKNPRGTPDFKTFEERDAWFKQHADYFTVVRKSGTGYERNEAPTLAEAVKLAKTKITIGGGRYMIYAVIGEQSAFVQNVQ